MTPTEIELFKTMTQYINRVDKIIGNWEMSEIKLTKLRTKIAELKKQCQFEILCNPDIFEASANEHFEQEEDEDDPICSECGSKMLMEHMYDSSFKYCMKCGANYKI